MSALTDTEHLPDGASVIWRQQHRGGYGYVTLIPGTVTGRTEKRIQILIYTVGCEARYIWVHPKNVSIREPA